MFRNNDIMTQNPKTLVVQQPCNNRLFILSIVKTKKIGVSTNNDNAGKIEQCHTVMILKKNWQKKSELGTRKIHSAMTL